jgi:hypothetical protein
MSVITVLRPDKVEQEAEPGVAATRSRLEDGAVLTLIDNGKPHAREMLELVADEVRRRLPQITQVDVFSKPSAGKPIDADEARMLAARSRLVITGLGD